METKVDNYFSPLNEEEQRLRLKKEKMGANQEKIVPSILWYCRGFYIFLFSVTYRWAVWSSLFKTTNHSWGS